MELRPRAKGSSKMRSLVEGRYALAAIGAGVVVAAAALLFPIDIQACAVCWGSSGDSHRTDWALLFLMAMPFTIVGSIGGWLVYRYKHPCKMDLQELAAGQQHSTTQPIHKESGA